jgi:hypothetical protein
MRRLAIGLGALVLCIEEPALAQHATVAEALFRDAREAMKAGQYARACPKLAESQRLDPTLGTLINLAICEERLGRIATAWTRYREFLETAAPSDDRRPAAEKRLAAIEPELPRLNISIAGAAMDAVVQLDGVELRAASLGVDVPVDPGEHRLALSMPDGTKSERDVRVARKERVAVELSPPEPEVAPPEAPPVPPPSKAHDLLPVVKPARMPQKPPSAPPGPNRTLATAGYVTGAVGIAGLATAGVFAGLAFDRKGIVDDYCNPTTCSDRRGVEAAEEGATFVRIADVALVTGIVGLAVGGVLLWQSARVGVRAGPSTAAVSLTAVLP